MTYKLLYFILILILLFEISKGINKNNCECFSSTPTDNRLSKDENDSANDKFASDGEDILLMTQTPSGKTFEFNYIRTPLNKGFIISVKRVKDDEETQISNYPPMLNTTNNHKILNLLGNNNLLINDNTSTLKYYIRFLSTSLFNKEKAEYQKKSALLSKYNTCLKENIALSKKQAGDKCKTILS